ncbi:MAG TPA: hypothetical protein DEH25_03420 [Chloroflexi bacterium]|nr:hypothetical protein [Chloroflexota bacterium]
MPRTQISCPQCRQPIVADVQQLFDVGANPEDKQRFLSGQVNFAQCPACGYQGGLATPLVYHDPEKELLLTYFPAELALPVREQERVIGPLIKKAVDGLPQEKRKGYLFNPRTMFTLQLMMETVLEADGITKEMIRAQQDRMRLIERLITASPESQLQIIQQEEQAMDDEFFGLFGSLMQAAMYNQDENAARELNGLQNLLLEHTAKGREIKAQSGEVQAALKALQALGNNLTREKIADLVAEAPSETRLQAYVQFVRQAMDYEFFTILSARIDQANGETREKLVEKRQLLLTLTLEYDEEMKNRAQVAQKNLETLLQAPKLEEAVMQNIEAIDDLFLQVLTSELDAARKAGNLDRSARLQQIMTIIESASAPPDELVFVEELMDLVDDEAALAQALEENADEVTPELMQVLTSLIAQGQAVAEEAKGKEKAQQQETVARIQKVYEAVLRFAMRRSFKGG